MKRVVIAIAAMLAIGLGVWNLEKARHGLERVDTTVGDTPVTVWSSTPGPVVVVAHGFAGSRQLMEAWALTLARAGYVAVSFDFQGHGKHPQPMSGDVTRIEGTTRMLMDQTRTVIDWAQDLPQARSGLALLGHSMATDVLIRLVLEDDIENVVAISAYSEAITTEKPERLLMITGEYEGFLRDAAVDAVAMVADVGEGATAVRDSIERRAVVAPMVEHVGVLYSATGLKEAREWLDTAFNRNTHGPVAATGGWIVLALTGIVALAWPLAKSIPSTPAPRPIPNRLFWWATVVPFIATPLILAPFDLRFLPVLVADYLAIHAGLYGLLALGILRAGGVRIGGFSIAAFAVIAGWGILGFGGFLERYVASFYPNQERLLIVVAICIGAIPAFIAEAALTQAGSAPLWRKAIVRLSFLGSLAIAVALDFEGLFFLILILPLILLFYASFGVVGGWIGRRTGATLGVGIALGLCLGWGLGVSFPMFEATLGG